jgi:AcrR family transcriptional regulator
MWILQYSVPSFKEEQKMDKDVSGGGIEAAARTLELLWGARKQPRRGPRRTLSVERIVEAAIRIADEEGLETLSMRRVADRLGAGGAMSLYTYVPGKTELVNLMLDAVMGEEARPDGEAKGWRAGLELYAREGWKLYHRHPWMLQAPLSRGLMGPNQTASLDSVLRSVSGLGLSEREMVAVVSVVAGYVQGAARTSVDISRLEKDTDITDEQWWATYGELMSQYVADAERYPTLASLSLSAWWAFDGAKAEFEFGLQRVLDGIEALIHSRSERPQER